MFREPKPDPKPEKKSKVKKPIKKVIDKRKRELAIYDKLKKVYMEENPNCEVCKVNKSKDLHHRAGRKGSWLTKWSNFLAVCRPCHRKITDDSLWAIENGYSEYRNR